ncbi:MAG: class I adenylate-forming enzyme family protein [Verrucomicrobiota bacterium]
MPANLVTRWNEVVRLNSEAVALTIAETGRSWTRGELASEVEMGVRRLDAVEREAIRGRRVVLAVPNGMEWLVGFLILLEARAIPALLDASESDENQRVTARAVGAVALWRDGGLEMLEARGPVLGEDPGAARVGLNRREKGYTRLALVKVTSGSTGTPKALVFTHEQMIADGENVCASMGIRTNDVNLGVIPFGHSYGLGNLVMPLLLQGSHIVVAANSFPHVLAAAIEDSRVTVFPAVPAILRGLVRSEIARDTLASLRLVISAGAPLPEGIAAELFSKLGLRVHNFYGSSETGGICFDRDGQATLEGRSVGTPLNGVTIQWGRGGRFWVEGGAVVGRGRYSPPDRAERNEKGEMMLLGRVGRMVKVGGRRLELAEVEKAARLLPGVKDACALLIPDRVDSIAVVVARDAQEAGSGEELRRLLCTKIAPWKVPSRWIVVSDLPYTARGKLDARRLREMVQGR